MLALCFIVSVGDGMTSSLTRILWHVPILPVLWHVLIPISPGTCLQAPKTWVHEIFEGTLTNELKCLTCESVGH